MPGKAPVLFYAVNFHWLAIIVRGIVQKSKPRIALAAIVTDRSLVAACGRRSGRCYFHEWITVFIVDDAIGRR